MLLVVMSGENLVLAKGVDMQIVNINDPSMNNANEVADEMVGFFVENPKYTDYDALCGLVILLQGILFQRMSEQGFESAQKEAEIIKQNIDNVISARCLSPTLAVN